MQIWKRFKADRRGTAAVLFGFSLIPIAGAAGLALDTSRAIAARSALQHAADATSLHMAQQRHLGRAANHDAVFASEITKRLDARAVRSQGAWDSGTRRYVTTASATVPTTLFSLFRPKTDVDVTATAAAVQQVTTVEVEGANLSPEAADYNELSVYCFNTVTKDRLGVWDAKAKRRLGFQKIADNSDEGVARPPQNLSVSCRDGETISYHLKNVRNARTNPQLRRTGETWNHYTDTTMVGGVPRHNTQYRDLVETIVCETRAKCRPRAEGGILPNNHETERNPAVASTACQAGQYLYLGWEDRPPNVGQWTDRDYDDIRLVMRCPGTVNGPLAVRLVE